MKKILICTAIVAISLMLLSVFANISLSAQDNEQDELDKEISEKVSEKLEEVSPDISEETEKYVKEFVKKRNIKPEKINNVSEVNFDDLPKEINIENVNDANLAIYEISYNQTDADSGKESPEKIFVITYSVEKLKAQGDLIVAHDKREFLNFGFEGETSESVFLDTATGIETSLEKGYVMPRRGSITAISTNLEIIGASEGEIQIIIYKNGEAIQFGNSIDSSSAGVKKDYDVQSNNVVTFDAGDVISAYANTQSSGAVFKDIINLVEITTK